MLTNEQLAGLPASSPVLNRVQGAVILVAEEIRNENAETPNHANRMDWANRAFSSPAATAAAMSAAVVARYATTINADGSNLTDAQATAAVRDAVDVFATGV